MDQNIIDEFKKAGADFTLTKVLPIILIKAEHNRKIVPLDNEAIILSGKKEIMLKLKKTSDLFIGNKSAPDFTNGPTEEFLTFFCIIEYTAADYCSINGHPEYDKEFERLYTLLRKKPDGIDSNPLYSYLQTACKLYMSLRDVSSFEFEEVARRLAISARKFAEGYASSNYFNLINKTFHSNQ